MFGTTFLIGLLISLIRLICHDLTNKLLYSWNNSNTLNCTRMNYDQLKLIHNSLDVKSLTIDTTQMTVCLSASFLRLTIPSLTFKFPCPATIQYQKSHQNERHTLHLGFLSGKEKSKVVSSVLLIYFDRSGLLNDGPGSTQPLATFLFKLHLLDLR